MKDFCLNALLKMVSCFYSTNVYLNTSSVLNKHCASHPGYYIKSLSFLNLIKSFILIILYL